MYNPDKCNHDCPNCPLNCPSKDNDEDDEKDED